MTAQPVFPNAPFKSHMPFFDGKTLLFCRAGRPVRQRFRCGGSIWARMEKNPALWQHFACLRRFKAHTFRPWQLAYCPWSDRRPTRLETGLPPGSVECSPTCYRENGVYHLSFIGRSAALDPPIYHLYRMSGPSLDRMGRAKRFTTEPTRIGFVSPRYVCLGYGLRLTLTERATKTRLLLDCPLRKIYHLGFSPDRLDNLIITGADAQHADITLVYRIDADETLEVRAPAPVYKATLFANQVVFARRFSGEFEDRQLWHGRYELVPSAVNVRRADP